MGVRDNAFAVVMSGGRGERFWPCSRRERPKQFLKLLGECTLLERTIRRLSAVFPAERIIVVTGAGYVKLSRETLPMLPPENIIGEPDGRDTAPALVLAAALVESRGGEAMAVFPADAAIQDEAEFASVIKSIMVRLEKDMRKLYTVGIRAAYPAECYGYIECGSAVESGEAGFFNVRSFREKPDRKTAEEFLRKGGYYWNGGIFIWTTEFFREKLALHAPDMAELLENIRADIACGKFEERLPERYSNCRKISIDYALQEKAGDTVVREGDFGWDDVGSFPALRNHLAGDENGNVSSGIFRGVDVRNSIILSGEDHLVAAVGVQDMLIIHTDDVTLVAPASESQRIKELLKTFDESMQKFC